MINDCVNSWISPGSWIVGQRGHVSSRRSQVGGGVSGLVQTVQRGRGRGPLAAHVTDCFPPSNQRSLPQSPAVINHPTLTNELEQSASHLTYHGHSGRDGGEQAAYSMASIYDMQREGFKFDFFISGMLLRTLQMTIRTQTKLKRRPYKSTPLKISSPINRCKCKPE